MRRWMGFCERGPWNLHEGMNVGIDLSAFATFGGGNSHTGFGQRLDATYVKSLDERLWMAIGAYADHTSFGGASYRSAGVYGMLGYRIDEHWEVAVYGQKSLSSNMSPHRRWLHSPYRPYRTFLPYGVYGPYNPYGFYQPGADRLGGTVTYHFSPAFSLSVSVESWRPNYDDTNGWGWK
ncbi:MAG: hypothetical protein IJ539_02900 [Prevotella sp.]|nr:hypothetical protein [Prevotella sp.]MBQ9533256.1 hypothetical protein [Prevotella sp.]